MSKNISQKKERSILSQKVAERLIIEQICVRFILFYCNQSRPNLRTKIILMLVKMLYFANLPVRQVALKNNLPKEI